MPEPARHTAQYSANQLGIPIQVENWAEELEKVWFEELNQSFLDIEKPAIVYTDVDPDLAAGTWMGWVRTP